MEDAVLVVDILRFTLKGHRIGHKTGKLQQTVHLYFLISVRYFWIFYFPVFCYDGLNRKSTVEFEVFCGRKTEMEDP